MLIFYTIKCPYSRHWISTGNMFTYVCCGWFFKIIFTSIYFFNNFRYWLNSNILVSSDGIPIPQKSFFYIVLWIDSEVVYRWGVAEQFGLRKSHLRNHWNLFVFIAYTQLFIYKKRANFNPIGAIFSQNYSDTPICILLSLSSKLYATQTASILQS